MILFATKYLAKDSVLFLQTRLLTNTVFFNKQSFALMFSLAKKAEAKNLQTTSRGIGIPPDWEPMTTSVRFKRVPLSPNAGGMMQKEYKMVAEKFNKTLGQATILQIERVQNVYSWETYQL